MVYYDWSTIGIANIAIIIFFILSFDAHFSTRSAQFEDLICLSGIDLIAILFDVRLIGAPSDPFYVLDFPSYNGNNEMAGS